MKYLFFDLDGTLLNSEKIITENTKAYLKSLHELGYVLGIASGRAITGVKNALENSDACELFDVIVCAGGADIYDYKDNTQEKRNYLNHETIKNMLEDLRNRPELCITFHEAPYLYATNNFPRVEKIVKMNKFIGHKNPYVEETYTKTARIVILLPEENREVLRSELRNKVYPGLWGYNAEEEVYEYISEHNSKSKGIADYVKKYGDSLDDVMCFGDSENDIDMLEKSGVGVCMKNGEEKVKLISDFVTSKTCDEDGVIEFLKQHIKKENKICQEKK